MNAIRIQVRTIMEVSFLKADDVGNALSKFISTYDELHWAVAWGTINAVTNKLLSHANKFYAVTFGLSFSQTDPDFVDQLIGKDGGYVVTKFPNGTYHPKIYAFRSGDQAAAIIGSSNFTNGGLEKNHEASILLTGSIHDQTLADIFQFVGKCAEFGTPVTKELATRYRIGHRIASRMKRPTRDPIAEMPKSIFDPSVSPLIEMSWKDYVTSIKGANYHDISKSLALLRTAQTWLSAASSFGNLSTSQRKAIAGVIGEKEKSADAELNKEWAWFGSMRGSGDFSNRISENDDYLARAVDIIPHKGEITKEHFERFHDLFLKAFANSHRTGDIATGSRLLAMKRPDVFICISSPNRSAAADRMGFRKSTLKFENYWERVVEVIRASEWYNIDKPEGGDGELWECRAAMLDAIFYRPQ